MKLACRGQEVNLFRLLTARDLRRSHLRCLISAFLPFFVGSIETLSSSDIDEVEVLHVEQHYPFYPLLIQGQIRDKIIIFCLLYIIYT